MLRVTIELVPFGVGTPKHLSTILLGNDMSLTAEDRSRGAYDVRVFGRDGRHLKRRDARVEDWPRLSKPVQALVAAALKAAGYA